MIRLEKHQIVLVDDDGETQVGSVIPFLNHSVELESGFNLEHFFKLIAKEADIFGLVFGSHLGHFSIQAYIDDALKECPIDDKDTEINHLEVYWGAESWDDRKYYEKHTKPCLGKKAKGEKLSWLENLGLREDAEEPGEDVLPEINIWVDFHGWGLWQKGPFDDPDAEPCYGGVAIEFCPIHQIKHIPIYLNKNFTLYDELDDYKVIYKGTRDFTVYDFFGAILYELSFCGEPSQRDKSREALFEQTDEMMEKYKNGDTDHFININDPMDDDDESDDEEIEEDDEE